MCALVSVALERTRCLLAEKAWAHASGSRGRGGGFWIPPLLSRSVLRVHAPLLPVAWPLRHWDSHAESVFVSWDVYVFEGPGGREGGSQAASLLCLGPGAQREGLTIPLSFAFPFSLPRV